MSALPQNYRIQTCILTRSLNLSSKKFEEPVCLQEATVISQDRAGIECTVFII
jgi:hypothetical protein